MKKILLCGDSFSIPVLGSWAHSLTTHFHVTNLALAGCSEYRIWKQLTSMRIENFDHVLICHTSPYRIYSEQKLINHKLEYYENSDLIYSDAKNRTDQTSMNVAWMFENVISLEHQEFMHDLLTSHIKNYLDNACIRNTHITFFETNYNGIKSFYKIWKKYNDTQSINHLNAKGNRLVLEWILNKIK